MRREDGSMGRARLGHWSIATPMTRSLNPTFGNLLPSSRRYSSPAPGGTLPCGTNKPCPRNARPDDQSRGAKIFPSFVVSACISSGIHPIDNAEPAEPRSLHRWSNDRKADCVFQWRRIDRPDGADGRGRDRLPPVAPIAAVVHVLVARGVRLLVLAARTDRHRAGGEGRPGTRRLSRGSSAAGGGFRARNRFMSI